MKLSHRFVAVAVALSMSASTIVLPVTAYASEEGKRNSTYALGAAAAALLLTQKNKLPGIIAAAGAGVAYKQYDDSVKNRHRYEDYGYRDPNGRRNNDGYRYNDSSSSDSRYRRNGDYYNNDTRYHRTNDGSYGYNDNSYNTGRYRNYSQDTTGRYRANSQDGCEQDQNYDGGSRYRGNDDDYDSRAARRSARR